MPNGPGRVRSAKTQRNPPVTLAYRAPTRRNGAGKHMPVMRLHVHNGGGSKIPILQKAPRA
jgi:hypothetical protein